MRTSARSYAASGLTRGERIVSTGQASPPGFWYDQADGEFVVLVAGAARLRFEDGDAAFDLKPGDWVEIPAHARHRVEHRKESVRHRIQMLRSDRRKNGEVDAVIRLVGITDVVGTSVNGHVVTARRKTRSELFRKSFEPAVVGWNAARSKDGEFHRVGL